MRPDSTNKAKALDNCNEAAQNSTNKLTYSSMRAFIYYDIKLNYLVNKLA